MNLHFINENEFVSVEEKSGTFGKTIEFPNNDGVLYIANHGDPDNIDDESADDLEEIALQIADNYEEFKQKICEYIVQNLEEEIDPSEILECIDLKGISSSNDNENIIVFTIECGNLLEDNQVINIYYNLEAGEFTDIETIDSDEESESCCGQDDDDDEF
jgi:hypothetical protein